MQPPPTGTPASAPPARPRGPALALALAPLVGLVAAACMARPPQPPPGAAIEGWPLPDGTLPQTDDDESVTYALLEPGSGEFQVRYEVSATTPGATTYHNILRKGSEVRDLRAFDLYTGRALAVEVIDGAEAREEGHPTARADVDYLQIQLLRPVPADGQARLAIEKVYGDPSGYFLEDGHDDGRIVFARVMNIRRNAVVLPAGYELSRCNHPVRVAAEPDGRLHVSFDKTGQSPVFLVLKARPLAGDAAALASVARDASAAGTAAPASEHADVRTLAPDRELLIDLGDPRRGAFRAVHDFTESDPGRTSRAVAPADSGTVVRARATLLDTGEPLTTRVERADEGGPGPDVVAVDFPEIEPGRSARLRVEELRHDRAGYRVEDGELVWRARADGALRRLVLPEGWFLTGNTHPAVVSTAPDGRLVLRYAPTGGDELELTVRARPRPATAGAAPAGDAE